MCLLLPPRVSSPTILPTQTFSLLNVLKWLTLAMKNSVSSVTRYTNAAIIPGMRTIYGCSALNWNGQNINVRPAFALTLVGKLTWLWNISECLLGIKYSSLRFLWKNRAPWRNHVFFFKNWFREEITVSVEAPFLMGEDWLFIWYRILRHGIVFPFNRPDGAGPSGRAV